MKLFSNNPGSNTGFEIVLLDQEGSWLNYKIVLHSADKQIEFESKNKKVMAPAGTIAEIGKFAFALEPINDIEVLNKGIQDLQDGKINKFRFEPVDPSFELIIEVIPNECEESQEKTREYKVYFWVDAGNTQQLDYTWDALGLRFICTSLELLKQVVIARS